MNNCCMGKHMLKFLGKKTNMSIKENEGGLQIDIVPKDKEKTQELKNLFKAVKEFCGCEGDSCECNEEHDHNCCS